MWPNVLGQDQTQTQTQTEKLTWGHQVNLSNMSDFAMASVEGSSKWIMSMDEVTFERTGIRKFDQFKTIRAAETMSEKRFV